MKAVLQRVTKASVSVADKITGTIDNGLVILLGVGHHDTESQASFLAEKIINLRIFEDENGKLNRSLLDVQGELLVISQFTLFGDCHKGRRPSFVNAAYPETAERLYEYFVQLTREKGIHTETGVFGAMMDVTLTNSGPVTLTLDTEELKPKHKNP
ncbi:D-tyrosyl-tRNA(Tyr) deacylase [Desulfamplus magnetovallimortis]|uniref:D-aminoacyl-tRNA deacylase n=1 Tax=Desulfamplus magnetovallimortis TaxID=1246637 RepID=A0A1W1H550_9BACT|nr:D-aminoacyl-tRNA deacylase [Desulfamplus magnetovallimortis]SLM27601.1 D-tyrosyl-tRNA(Tyr) deacylase [Desulfamplus magnetovallimortis]